MRWNARKTGLAGLLALMLLLGSLATASPAHADEAAAVFYGYVVAEPGGVLPKRVRALSEHGAVCGSAEVSATLAANVGFYALAVVSGDVKDGCPASGGPVRFAFVYGMIDEDVIVGAPAAFRSGEVIPWHLVRAAADVPLAQR